MLLLALKGLTQPQHLNRRVGQSMATQRVKARAVKGGSGDKPLQLELEDKVREPLAGLGFQVAVTKKVVRERALEQPHHAACQPLMCDPSPFRFFKWNKGSHPQNCADRGPPFRRFWRHLPCLGPQQQGNSRGASKPCPLVFWVLFSVFCVLCSGGVGRGLGARAHTHTYTHTHAHTLSF